MMPDALTNHPTAAVAAPSPSLLLVPAWYDFDGKHAPERALDAAGRLVAITRGLAFVVRRHAEGAHVLSPQLVPWDRYLKNARQWGADTKAAEIAVERGQPFLRVSPRPYDEEPQCWIVSKPGPYMNRVASVDIEQVAAVGAYLSTLSPTTLVATYRQETSGRRPSADCCYMCHRKKGDCELHPGNSCICGEVHL